MNHGINRINGIRVKMTPELIILCARADQIGARATASAIRRELLARGIIAEGSIRSIAA